MEHGRRAVAPAELVAAAQVWLSGDPDPADRAELQELARAAAGGGDEAVAELADRFAGGLVFGTAGLRGPLRAGPNGMNTAVVRRAAAGLATWLAGMPGGFRPGALDSGEPGSGESGAAGSGHRATVVIGYDARHRSERFAVDSARVFAGAGLRALLLPVPVPTPVLAFAVRHLDAAAGVMVTASHNPATDNGYKVYLGGPANDPGRGAQLVSPADEQIEAAIAAAPPAAAIPLADDWTPLGDEIVAAYVAGAAETFVDAGRAVPAAVRVAYTPLHGVGLGVLRRVFAAAGLPEPAVVAEQASPDPDFPTAPFPNPEEPGVMDRVIGLGLEIGADLMMANDPDADRLAVAITSAGGDDLPVGSEGTRTTAGSEAESGAGGGEPRGGEQRRVRLLTGDELGLLLADEILRHSPGLVATTVVSATALRALAARRGVPYAETLTGFKWIVRAGDALAFGYEEALGYAVRPGLVRDKDGITAAVTVAKMAAAEAARGRTLLDRLDDLSRELGVTATAQVSLRVTDLAACTTLMTSLRENPPDAIGGLRVKSIRDLLTPARAAPPASLPMSDVLIFTLAAGARAVVRPSGTEPKLKVYLEATQPVGSRPGALAEARSAAKARLDRLKTWASALGRFPG